MTNRKRLGALAVVLVVAALFRLYQLDVIPPGLFIDEALNGLVASEIQGGQQLPIFVETVANVKGRSREPMYHYLMAGVFAAVGPSVTSLRLTSALVGIITVLAFFWLAQKVFGLHVACIASVLLAVSRWHVTFSRIGFRAILVPLWFVLMLLALDRVVRRRTRMSALLFGAVTGLGLYTYPSYWIVPVPVAAMLLLGFWRAPAGTLAAYKSLAPLAFVGLVAALLPLIIYTIEQPETFFARAIEISTPLHRVEGLATRMLDHSRKVLLMLHFRGDPEARHNIPGAPLLDPITGAAFMIGLLALARNRLIGTPVKAGLVLFWLASLLPSVVTAAPPHAMRTLGAAPAVCLIAALGIDFCAAAAERRAVLRRFRPALLLPLIVLGMVAFWNARDYFGVWGKHPVVAADFSADIPRFHKYLVELASGDEIYASPYIAGSPQFRFLNLALADEQRPTHEAQGDADTVMRMIADEMAFVTGDDQPRDRVYVSEAPAINFLIEKHYPGAEIIGRYGVHGATIGKIYRVRRQRLKPTLTPAERAEIDYLLGLALAKWRARRDKL